jgi:hypothetical protein
MNIIFNEAKRLIFQGGVPPQMGVMLVKSTYVPNPDQLAIDDGTPNDATSHELTVAGYARLPLQNVVIGKDDATDFSFMDADDAVFGNLATGQTIGGAVVYREGGADTQRVPLFFYDTTDTPTNGSAITVQWATVSAGAMLKGVQV